MAFRTVIYPAGMIEHGIRESRTGAMTNTAVLSIGRRMARIRTDSAGRSIVRTAVMAGSAVSGNPGVIENRRCERTIVMAYITVLCRRQVTGSFHHIRVAAGGRQVRVAVTALAALGKAGMDIADENR